MRCRSFDFQVTLYAKCIFLNGFTNSDLDHRGASPGQKGNGENTDVGAVVSAEWRDWGRPLLTDGQRSQFNTLHRKVRWLGCFSQQDLQQASPETLPGVVLKTSYRYLLRSLHQTGVQRPSCRGGRYIRCFENLRVLPPLKLLNMRRGSNLYPGSKTPGVRQAGPEQDCSIISR